MCQIKHNNALTKLMTYTRDIRDQNYLQIIKMLFFFFAVLTFALMLIEQWWGKLVASYHKLRKWHQVVIFVNATHTLK